MLTNALPPLEAIGWRVKVVPRATPAFDWQLKISAWQHSYRQHACKDFFHAIACKPSKSWCIEILLMENKFINFSRIVCSKQLNNTLDSIIRIVDLHSEVHSCNSKQFNFISSVTFWMGTIRHWILFWLKVLFDYI